MLTVDRELVRFARNALVPYESSVWLQGVELFILYPKDYEARASARRWKSALIPNILNLPIADPREAPLKKIFSTCAAKTYFRLSSRNSLPADRSNLNQ
jgi:hypothetical protein